MNPVKEILLNTLEEIPLNPVEWVFLNPLEELPLNTMEVILLKTGGNDSLKSPGADCRELSEEENLKAS